MYKNKELKKNNLKINKTGSTVDLHIIQVSIRFFFFFFKFHGFKCLTWLVENMLL